MIYRNRRRTSLSDRSNWSDVQRYAFATRFIANSHIVLAQPEIMLEWYRALAHAHAVCQITAAVNASVAVPGWVCTSSNRLAERDQSEIHGQLRGTNNWGADLFELDGEGEIVVKPLNCRLQFVPSKRVSNLVCCFFCLFLY